MRVGLQRGQFLLIAVLRESGRPNYLNLDYSIGTLDITLLVTEKVFKNIMYIEI